MFKIIFSFNIDDHLIFAPPSFRARKITEANIQDYMSNIVSKYLPSDVPQWQMFVIPVGTNTNPNIASTSSASDSYYYILLRIHHLLLDEENLCVKELLCLTNPENSDIQVKSKNVPCENLLQHLIETPVHIPRLFNTISACINNRWNEFRYCFDPVIQGPGKHSNEGVLQLFAILVIIGVTVIQKFYKGFHAVQDNLLIRTRYFQTVLKEECSKRDLSWELVKHVSSPIQAIRDICHFWAWIAITFALTFPYKCLVEAIAVIQFILNGKPTRRSTFFKFFFEYIPLTWAAIKESYDIFYGLYSAPMLVYQEVFERNKYCDIHSLQKVSLCGRKVISWSDEINLDEIQSIPNITETELVFTAISNSLHDFFVKIDKCHAPPQQIDVSFTSIDDSHLLGKSPLNHDTNGMICLSMPLNDIPDTRLQLHNVRHIINKIHETQRPNYILSMYNRKYDLFTNAIPKVWMRIFINYLSRKYPIMVTQVIDSCDRSTEQIQTVWGDEVRDLLYFPPPQSNVCK